jgi:dihydrofolate synthase/folylpolyglutamate synthase
MNVRQAEDWLLGLELFGMRFGLDRMHKLMTVLGLPQRRFASIHVVGTNGKSSTVRFAAAILERHGLPSGSYTSPHLGAFSERIELHGRPLADDEFAEAVSRAAHATGLVDRTGDDEDQVTQFEALTAAAFHALARGGVEAAVIEAGLGGRYDATNVIPSKVQVLTSVGLDHTRWLGPTLADIAEEKLAVVRDHATLVLPPEGGLPEEAEAVAARVASERHARIVRAPADLGIPLAARGSFQRRNFALAATAAEALLERPLEDDALRSAAAAVRVPGRLEVVSEQPFVIHDGAHNADGATALAEALPEVVGDRAVVGVVSVLDDKDASAMLSALLPGMKQVVFTRCQNPRSLPPATLVTLAAKLGRPDTEAVASPHEALDRAIELAGAGGAVVATGSIYLIADLRRAPGEVRVSML